MSKRLVVIDGNSLMHRAYHAVQASMSAPDGTPTNAAYGFMSMFLKLVETTNPDMVVCAFDAGKPEFRLKAVEGYKANRKPMDDALRIQFPVVENLLQSLDVPIVKEKGWEGDDILGTLARMGERLGFETLLVTGDKDAYQLVNDLTKVVTTKKGISDIAIYGPQEVFDRYGVTPEQFIDFLALKGDASDNIPGVPGIGDKSAATLLQRYESIDGIYEHLSELKGKQRENIENNKDAAYASQTAATIACDVPIDIDLEAISWPSFSAQQATEAFSALRFSTHLKHVLSFAHDGAAASALQSMQLDMPNHTLLESQEAFDYVQHIIQSNVLCSVYLYEPEQLSLFEHENILFVATREQTAIFRGEAVVETLRNIVNNATWCAHDVKEIFTLLYPANNNETAYISYREMRQSNYFDISLAAYVLASHEKSYEVVHLVERFMGKTLPQEKDDLRMAAHYAQALLSWYEFLDKRLHDDGAYECYATIDAPLVPVLVYMERIGVAIDEGMLQTMASDAQSSMDDIRTRIWEYAGAEFNVDSPKQLSEVLFDVLGLTSGKKTKSGYSTDAATLQKIRHEHPIVEEVIAYRELAKLHSTYLIALPKIQKNDARIHTHFNQTIAATGRLSSSEPNLQNIPVRNELGKRIRQAFIPLRKDDTFISADYSQIELRLLAHLSEDEKLIEAFCNGQDFHAQTAAHVFNVPLDEVTSEMRSRAKAVNFGIVYGQQAFGLSQSLGIAFAEAKRMIDDYFIAYPKVYEYLESLKNDAHQLGYVSTIFGRRRYITDIASSNAQVRAFGERTAMNHPMQGSAADIIKLAMISIQDELDARKLDARMIIQVHDELDISCPLHEVAEVEDILKAVMQDVVSLRVPLVVDVTSGDNWALAH